MIDFRGLLNHRRRGGEDLPARRAPSALPQRRPSRIRRLSSIVPPSPNAVQMSGRGYNTLGVILFELLAGRLPYPLDGLPLAEVMWTIHACEPARLGSLDRSLRGDVETIVGKALEKDPARRYQSAQDLADDLRRHLRSEP